MVPVSAIMVNELTGDSNVTNTADASNILSASLKTFEAQYNQTIQDSNTVVAGANQAATISPQGMLKAQAALENFNNSVVIASKVASSFTRSLDTLTKMQ